jgi:lipopolysaccharide/colanic/teichoic acid biosynthesis glycosyltransferase
MTRTSPRIVDGMLIAWGGALPALVAGLNVADSKCAGILLIVLMVAFAPSPLPACAAYELRRRCSSLHLLFRTLLSWTIVQGGSIALLYLLGRTDVVSTLWFACWSFAGGIGLLVFCARLLLATRQLPVARHRAEEVTTDHSQKYSQPLSRSGSAWRRFKRLLKRAFDIAAASFLLVALSPALVAVAWLVRRDGGKAMFGHTRVGQNGQPFKCLKFRSMVMNADVVLKELLERDPQARAEWEHEFKLRDDVRITRIGRFLRRTSLDELPQLLNVVRGEMSLVGPRPIVKEELVRYGDNVRYYLMAKPGMTGLWQVSGRNDTDYATRVLLDVSYVKNWSLRRDLEILVRTVGVVVNGSGAY